MNSNPRCMYENTITGFLQEEGMYVFGIINDKYHGDARSTTRDAWKKEISIMKDSLSLLKDKRGQIIFEYDIPRLGKRVDVILLYSGIIFCI